jgi:hypothetical protein
MLRASFVLLAVACAMPAFADEDSSEKAQARVLLAQGNALFERGDLKGALVDFRAAYALYPSPKLLVNCAAAERELGDLAGAATDLRHFLDDETSEDDPFLVDRARGDLKLLEHKLGRIALSSWPARSTLEIDGKAARSPTYVMPGEHHVKARAPTGETLDMDVDVAAGGGADLVKPPIELLTKSPQAPPKRIEKRRSTAWIAGVVLGVLAVGAAVGVGVALAEQPKPQPLTGALGTYRFSEFH